MWLRNGCDIFIRKLYPQTRKVTPRINAQIYTTAGSWIYLYERESTVNTFYTLETHDTAKTQLLTYSLDFLYQNIILYRFAMPYHTTTHIKTLPWNNTQSIAVGIAKHIYSKFRSCHILGHYTRQESLMRHSFHIRFITDYIKKFGLISHLFLSQNKRDFGLVQCSRSINSLLHKKRGSFLFIKKQESVVTITVVNHILRCKNIVHHEQGPCVVIIRTDYMCHIISTDNIKHGCFVGLTCGKRHGKIRTEFIRGIKFFAIRTYYFIFTLKSFYDIYTGSVA